MKTIAGRNTNRTRQIVTVLILFTLLLFGNGLHAQPTLELRKTDAPAGQCCAQIVAVNHSNEDVVLGQFGGLAPRNLMVRAIGAGFLSESAVAESWEKLVDGIYMYRDDQGNPGPFTVPANSEVVLVELCQDDEAMGSIEVIYSDGVQEHTLILPETCWAECEKDFDIDFCVTYTREIGKPFQPHDCYAHVVVKVSGGHPYYDSDGRPYYHYEWSNHSSNQSWANILPGNTLTVKITDSMGCSIEKSITPNGNCFIAGRPRDIDLTATANPGVFEASLTLAEEEDVRLKVLDDTHQVVFYQDVGVHGPGPLVVPIDMSLQPAGTYFLGAYLSGNYPEGILVFEKE